MRNRPKKVVVYEKYIDFFMVYEIFSVIINSKYIKREDTKYVPNIYRTYSIMKERTKSTTECSIVATTGVS